MYFYKRSTARILQNWRYRTERNLNGKRNMVEGKKWKSSDKTKKKKKWKEKENRREKEETIIKIKKGTKETQVRTWTRKSFTVHGMQLVFAELQSRGWTILSTCVGLRQCRMETVEIFFIVATIPMRSRWEFRKPERYLLHSHFTTTVGKEDH